MINLLNYGRCGTPGLIADCVGLVVGVVTGPTAGEPGVTGIPLVLGGCVGGFTSCGVGFTLLGSPVCCGALLTGLGAGDDVVGDMVFPGMGLLMEVLTVSVCAEASPKASNPAMVYINFFIALFYGLFGVTGVVVPVGVVPVAEVVLFGCDPAGFVVDVPAPGVTVVGEVVVVVDGFVIVGVVTVGCTVGVFVIVVLLLVVPAGLPYVLLLFIPGVVVVDGVEIVVDGCCTGFVICLLAGLVAGVVVFTCADAKAKNIRPVSV